MMDMEEVKEIVKQLVVTDEEPVEWAIDIYAGLRPLLMVALKDGTVKWARLTLLQHSRLWSGMDPLDFREKYNFWHAAPKWHLPK